MNVRRFGRVFPWCQWWRFRRRVRVGRRTTCHNLAHEEGAVSVPLVAGLGRCRKRTQVAVKYVGRLVGTVRWSAHAVEAAGSARTVPPDIDGTVARELPLAGGA
jgi:hypothetical protein